MRLVAVVCCSMIGGALSVAGCGGSGGVGGPTGGAAGAGAGGTSTGGSGGMASGGTSSGGTSSGGTSSGGTGGGDAACQQLDSNGFFPDCTACGADCDTIDNGSGARQACGCTNGCPCGLSCGCYDVGPGVSVCDICIR